MRLSGKYRTLAQTVGVVVVMGALAWASVPFYDWFCRVTGFGGATSVADAGSDEILDRTIKIRFDANVERGMPWVFKPMVREMELKIGETGLAFYEADQSDRPAHCGHRQLQRHALRGGRFFHQDRLFLLRRTGVAARRDGADARYFLCRSGNHSRP